MSSLAEVSCSIPSKSTDIFIDFQGLFNTFSRTSNSRTNGNHVQCVKNTLLLKTSSTRYACGPIWLGRLGSAGRRYWSFSGFALQRIITTDKTLQRHPTTTSTDSSHSASLHWQCLILLPFLLCLLMHLIHIRQAQYLIDGVSTVSGSRCRLRSTDSADCVLPKTRNKLSECGFCCSLPAAWNSLHDLTDTKTFKKTVQEYTSWACLFTTSVRCSWMFRRVAPYKCYVVLYSSRLHMAGITQLETTSNASQKALQTGSIDISWLMTGIFHALINFKQ